ncbi:xylulokinase [Marasmitruncus massiliensis]|uniref:xylulokinase n=1 Tax=Marasmitruncus massiliensis TaxID=1944642 RepID=UPI000C7C545C|nr:FGGY-family carbohydrate kinase [Marasmitruncus massiliensis]
MGEVLLGIDIGTSACKAAAFTTDGKVLAQATENYKVYYPQPGWAEQDPEEWWRAVCRAIRAVLEKGVCARDVQGVGVDGQSWSAIAVDREGNVLCRTPIWFDTRAVPQCEQMKVLCGCEKLFSVSGNPLQPMYTMPKVLWYKQNRPEVYTKADQILQSNSFIAYRLTGVCSQEHSQGYGWSCYDVAAKTWDAELCAELGVRPELLPLLVQSHNVIGGITVRAARETGLAVGTPVVAGGLDAACGTLGAGVTGPGQTQEQGGQAGGMSICIGAPRAEKRLILSPHVVPQMWLLQGGTVGGGGAVNWFLQEFGAAEHMVAEQSGTNPFQEMDRGAADIPAGSEGLVFLPYLAGERSPLWNAKAKGVFYGIDFSKTRAHFARAVMEGVACSLRHNLEVAEAAGAHTKTLRAMGGAANSSLWMQIKADITGKRIEVPSSDTATALGAAILAGVGTNIYADFDEAVRRTVHIRCAYEPCETNLAVYSSTYQIYRELYENLKSLMNRKTII